ncbi:MAG: hypothetical protein WB870_04190 [Gallionellaceae bacterium]
MQKRKNKMQCFDKRMALEVIEDALRDTDTPHGRGVASGLCGAFYMCGLLSAEEWEAFLKRIPVAPRKVRASKIRWIKGAGAKVRGRFMN